MKFEKKKKKINLQKRTTSKIWGLVPALPTPQPSFLDSVFYLQDASPMTIILEPIKTRRAIKFTTKQIVSDLPLEWVDHSASIFDKYYILRTSSFIKFFDTRQVDVPRCFKPVKSLRRLNFELPLTKLTNYLMKQGKKEKIIRNLMSTFHAIFKIHQESPLYTKNLDLVQWTQIYFFYNSVLYSKNRFTALKFPRYANLLNQHFVKQNLMYHSLSSNLKTFMLRYLLFLKPLFHFSLFSLDKKARKFARKKGSKYVFIWKYVPVYKRNNLLLKLIASDIKFNTGKTLNERLKTSFNTIYSTPKLSYAYQINNFAHNYVFKNFKRSLLVNFKTTS